MAGMRDTTKPFRWVHAAGVLVALAGIGIVVSMGQGGASGDAASAENPLIHWRDAGHDWLVVLERDAGEVAVYDAADGRPLRRLGAAQGVAGAERMVREGPWLVLLGREGGDVRWINLAQQVQAGALAAR
jgi:hypothetical protein